MPQDPKKARPAPPDERVFLENGGDGVTYATDGIHPNAAGIPSNGPAMGFRDGVLGRPRRIGRGGINGR